jgi:hypothetical protein
MTYPPPGDQAVQELDDPEWPMPQPFGGQRSVPRRLRVWRGDDGTRYAVITERGTGMSVTNVAEHAHAALAARWPGARVRVLEHYPAEGDSGEHFDEITLDRGRPVWRRIPTEFLLAELGDAVLDDLPPLPPDPFSC